VPPASASAANWPQYGFGPGLDGFNAAESTIGPANVHSLVLRWAKSVDYSSTFATGGADGTPIEGGGSVFVGTSNHHLEAFNATTGAGEWIGPARRGNISFNGSPVYAKGVVYENDPGGGRVYAFNAKTGHVIWTSAQYGSGGVSDTGLTLVGNTLLEPLQSGLGGSAPGGVVALKASNGKKLWELTPAGQINNESACVVGNSVYILTGGSGGSTVTAIALGTGKKQWSAHFAGFSTTSSTSAVAGGLLLALGTNSGNGQLIKISTTSKGKKLWAVPLSGTPYGTPAVAYGDVFVGTSTKVYAFKASTHGLLWSAPDDGRAVGGISVADHVAFFAEQSNVTGSGVLVGLSTAAGHQLWSASLANDSNSEPVVVNGSVYVTDFGGAPGYLYRFALL